MKIISSILIGLIFLVEWFFIFILSVMAGIGRGSSGDDTEWDLWVFMLVGFLYPVLMYIFRDKFEKKFEALDDRKWVAQGFAFNVVPFIFIIFMLMWLSARS